MLLLMISSVLAGTVHFSTGGSLVYVEGDQAVVLDSWRNKLIAGGAWSDLEGEYAPPADPGEYRYASTVVGTILAQTEDSALVRKGDVIKRVAGGGRWRADLPSWWGFRHTQVVYDSSMALLYDGRTALLVEASGELTTFDVRAGHGPIALYGTHVAFSGRPDVVLDLFRKQLVELDDLEFEDVRWAGGTVVGGTDGRAVVWDDSGRVRFVLDEPDYGDRRLSVDGTELGLMFVREGSRVGQLRDTARGEVLGEWEVCGDGHRIWPVGEGQIVDLCGESVVLRGPEGSREIGTIPGLGPVSHVSLSGAGVRVVAGDGSHGVEVWKVSLHGGVAEPESWDWQPGGTGVEVKGYEAGVPRDLHVDDVHGKPVEIATARAFRKMERAARSDGVTLRVASGFRTWAEQSALYDCYRSGDCNGGNLAAPPGFSNHQSGLALDLNTHTTQVRRWLGSRGAEFGFAATVRSEAWHWEYVGGERHPAVAVAMLPPAEPLFLVPKTPWSG